jgi:hypothetical protein
MDLAVKAIYRRRMRQAFWSLFSLLTIVIFVACIYNMMSDNFEVAALAEATACREESGVCEAQQTYVERNPFAETFEFSTLHRRKLRVRCMRSLIFAGAYSCAARVRLCTEGGCVETATVPAVSGSAPRPPPVRPRSAIGRPAASASP